MGKLIKCIQAIYLFFILVWFFIIVVIQLYKVRGIGPIVMFIPPIVFVSGYINAPYIKKEDEEQVFEASFLAIGLLVLVPLLNWMRDGYKGNCERFIKMILTGIAITLLSVLDIWCSKEYMRLNRHIRLCLETIAVTIFILTIVDYSINADYENICKK